jgi:alpha-mannosidase
MDMDRLNKIHLIGNAHIDPVWLWRWQEGFAEIKATFRSALDRLDEFPGFIFTCACASYYQWIEENEPPMFEEIRRRVAEGRWAVVGGWWLQPDCNLPSGESFARHALYSQRFFRQKFGKIAQVGYNVDSFGHHGMLPQLLHLSGMDSYVMMRPDSKEKKLPSNVFWWESPDGSRVLTFRIPFGYGSGWGRERILRKVDATDELMKEQDIPFMMFYGVGNHGGGPTIASLQVLEELRASRGTESADYSSPDAYFDELRATGRDFPVVTGDLQHHASGCYSAISEIKANNRKAECRLVNAEKMMTVASRLLGLPYRNDWIKRAWEDVLFNQFHDVMGGCSIQQAYDDARECHGEALKLAADALNAAVQKISWAIDTMGDASFHPSKDNDWKLWEMQNGSPVVVFNPLPWDVDAVVQVPKKISGLTDETGSPLCLQTVRAPQTNETDKWDSLFTAKIPALGYRVFRAFKEKEFAAPASGHFLCAGCSLENDWLRLELDPATGAISRLYDKSRGQEVLRGCGAVPVVIDDSESDTWAHGIFEFRKEAGRFSDAQVKLIEEGPLRATLRAISRYGQSELRQDFTIYRDRPGVDVHVRLNWQEKLSILKFSFPVNVANPVPVYEIPYGSLERAADGREYPGQAWVDVSGVLPDGTRYGLALANTAKYSYDVLDSELRLTVARSSIYADHYGVRDDQVEFMDQGLQYFAYSLYPHEGGWQKSGIVRRAQELLNPAVTVLETWHKGILPLCSSFLSVSQANIIVSALKIAEDGDDLVVRCVETEGRKTEAAIDLKFAGIRWDAVFGPFEIKTFRIGRTGAVCETNLLEDITEDNDEKADRH